MSRPEPDWIEVAYALPERQWVIRMDLREGLTAQEAVQGCGILDHVRSEDREPLALGVYGRPVPQDRTLRPGDRVEIYRKLRMDPREARRRLAAEGRTMGRSRR